MLDEAQMREIILAIADRFQVERPNAEQLEYLVQLGLLVRDLHEQAEDGDATAQKQLRQFEAYTAQQLKRLIN